MGHAQLLRASSEKVGKTVNLGAIGNPFVPSGVDHGRELLAIADAVTLRDRIELHDAIVAMKAAAGDRATVRAIAVAANFGLMNRLLDGLGVAHGGSPELAAEIGFTGVL